VFVKTLRIRLSCITLSSENNSHSRSESVSAIYTVVTGTYTPLIDGQYIASVWRRIVTRKSGSSKRSAAGTLPK
jgi:hypothetical protein